MANQTDRIWAKHDCLNNSAEEVHGIRDSFNHFTLVHLEVCIFREDEREACAALQIVPAVVSINIIKIRWMGQVSSVK